MGLFSTFFGSTTREESRPAPARFDWITVQYQDRSGNWIDHESFPAGGANVPQYMFRASRVHPGKRIRAVDSAGRFIDNL